MATPGELPGSTTGRGDTPAQPRRVLMIEDDPDVGVTLVQVLRLLGHEVELATDVVRGLERARRSQADVIFCDLGLPGIGGYEVARALREDPATRHIFLVALSGYALPADVERALAAGFDRHVAKPAGAADLAAVLAEAPRR